MEIFGATTWEVMAVRKVLWYMAFQLMARHPAEFDNEAFRGLLEGTGFTFPEDMDKILAEVRADLSSFTTGKNPPPADPGQPAQNLGEAGGEPG